MEQACGWVGLLGGPGVFQRGGVLIRYGPDAASVQAAQQGDT